MGKDNSGIANTCPKIDEVITAIMEACRCIDNYVMNNKEISVEDEELLSNVVHDLKNTHDGKNSLLELIRTANSDLRDYGNNEYTEKQEIQSKLDTAERKIEDLEQDIKTYKSDIKTFQEEISILNIHNSDLEEEISNLNR